MSCEFLRESITSYLDGRLTEPERRSVASHLAACRECAVAHDQTARLRSSLRSLPAAAPQGLITDLRIMASKEVVRRRRMSRVPVLAEWMDRARLLVENLMQPLALPFAGGLTSALFMFAVLIPSLDILRTPSHDTPSPIYTVASVDNMDDFSARSKFSDDTVVE